MKKRHEAFMREMRVSKLKQDQDWHKFREDMGWERKLEVKCECNGK
jgi:hypothetical protein